MSQPTLQAQRSKPTKRSATRTPNQGRLSLRQIHALATAIRRELTWGLPGVAKEVHRWRHRATAIPDAAIREDAINAITDQRPHIDGAALFTIIPATRNTSLLHLLVSYEVIWDYLDNLNERTAHLGLANGQQLHQALVDALDPSREISAFYHHIPDHDDAHYLRALVAACRERYTRLPSHHQINKATIREAIRAEVCAINHEPNPLTRDITLMAWAHNEFPDGHEASWFELTAAASTDLTIFALLALATEPGCPADRIERISLAYFPWVSVLTAMLDSYVDQDEDLTLGNHTYLHHYPTHHIATDRIRELIGRCLEETQTLEEAPHKHTVIAACMFAMYLSKNTALAPSNKATTANIIQSGGALTCLLHPILRLWRRLYGLRAA